MPPIVLRPKANMISQTALPELSREMSNYTFTVDAYGSIRKMVDTCRPGDKPHVYDWEVLTSEPHLKTNVKVNVVQMECGNVIEVENENSMPAFVTLLQDGKPYERKTLA